MEFVGNQINFKTVLVTLTVTFFIGRICLFEGAFPGAIGLIAVMMAVSTLYVYLLPVLILSIISSWPAEMAPYGDIIAMVLCSVFFLFFHEKRFTINHRTAIVVAFLIISNCAYSFINNDMNLPGNLDLIFLFKEIIAVIIYIRVLNTLARMIYVGQDARQLSREKIELSFVIMAISVMGAFEEKIVVFTLWFLFIAVIAYGKNLKSALMAGAICDVFYRCQTGVCSSVFTSIFAGLLLGRFLASLVDKKYRKTIFGISMFACIVATTKTFDYNAAVSMAVFIALPTDIINKVIYIFEESVYNKKSSEDEIEFSAVRRELERKKNVFKYLSNMYKKNSGEKETISYEFEGMARVTERLIKGLEGDLYRKSTDEPVLVGGSSYGSGEVCGDSSAWFTFSQNRQGLIISDGMGKGEKAADESQMIVTTLSKLLEAGFDEDLALKIMNGIFMEKNGREIFATVDLAIINNRTKRTQVFKMGASSTFVMHENKVAILKSPAPPMGVIGGLKLEYIDIKLSRGDVLVMVSDGITDCDRSDPECKWLMERLETIGSRDPNVISEIIINKAVEKYGLKERDDLTVLVAVV